MGKKNRKKGNNKQPSFKEKINKSGIFALPEETKKWILGIIVFIVAVIIALSFFEAAGLAGKGVMRTLTFLVGRAVFILPLVLASAGLVFLNTKYDKFLGPVFLATLILTIGITGIIESFNPEARPGGWAGYVFTWPFLKLFNQLVSGIIFGGIALIGSLIFWHLLRGPKSKEKKIPFPSEDSAKENLIKQIFSPKFKVKELESKPKEPDSRDETPSDFKKKASPLLAKSLVGEYKIPPIDLLESSKGRPTAGDTITNTAIIKKTLDNFGLRVEMSEVNIGPTVTRYSLKPAEGIKLSKITALSNNLSLALASHPIRIEAPIPGKSLVGIEVPNKERCRVSLRELLAQDNFQRIHSNLTIALGQDVAGSPCYADLDRMPHLLVAGATGTGKTIFLNSLILSLLYQNSPEILRLILIDPKRVEFSAYKELPHLLCPVIFDAQRSINALKWLVSEMERRFEVLSQAGSRDISSYNEKAFKKEEELLPYIVLIVDELADLMAAKGREMEAGIVRLAQMARAVGIHLVLATQRPSVEVITGLIKANVTSRVTFQVASQVDSRTVLDMAGAEKLLGLGDMLFLSADNSKPRRIQAGYVSEKEVKRVVEFVNSQNSHLKPGETEQAKIEGEITENHLSQDLQRTLEGTGGEIAEPMEEDPLYEEAKKIVIASKKASASLLQRRLRVGYARAARLLDILEQKGVVGPGEGAKPREVYLEGGSQTIVEDEDGWQKV